MQEQEKFMEHRNFTSWLILFGQLANQSDSFVITDVNEANSMMSAKINKKDFVFTLHRKDNKLIWMNIRDTLYLSDLDQNGWNYTQSEPKMPFEILSSPLIKSDVGKTQIHLVWDPVKQITCVRQTIVPKTSR